MVPPQLDHYIVEPSHDLTVQQLLATLQIWPLGFYLSSLHQTVSITMIARYIKSCEKRKLPYLFTSSLHAGRQRRRSAGDRHIYSASNLQLWLHIYVR